MNKTKIIFGVALLAFCCISQSYSLKCYVCDSQDSCKKPTLQECTPTLADASRNYLQKFHNNVDANASSQSYECFRENVKGEGVTYYYKGCTYNNIDVCTLSINSDVLLGLKMRECQECYDRDGCNPAGRVSINVMTVFATIIVAAILRFVSYL